MVAARPSIVTALIWAYWDLSRAVGALWRLSLVALVIFCFGTYATLIGPVLLIRDPIGIVIARQVVLIGLSFLLTPFLLAIQRFVILGEVATRYKFDLLSRRFQLFFGWLVVSAILINTPSFLESLSAPKGPIYYVGSRPLAPDPSMVVTAARLTVLVMIQCFLILFPAVAIDAPGATWQNAVRDTLRRIWFVVSVSILPLIPVGLLGLAAAPLLQLLPWTFARMIAIMIGFGVMLLLISMLNAVIASRIYQVVGDRLNEPLHDV